MPETQASSSSPTQEAALLENSIETDDGVVFTFGKEKITVPPLNFYTIKKCWNFMSQVSAATDLIGRFDSVLEVVSVSLGDTATPYTPEELSKKLVGVRWQQEMSDSFRRLLIVSGLLTQEQIDATNNPQSGLQNPNLPSGVEGEVGAASSILSSAESLNGAQTEVESQADQTSTPSLLN